MKKAIALFLLAAGIITTSATVVAQQSGGGLEISPVRGELTLNPGDSGELSVRLKNTVAGPVQTNYKINDFEPQESGQNEPIPNETSEKDII